MGVEREAIALLLSAIDQGRYRRQDLDWCNKDDDCQTLGVGATLVIEDIESWIGHHGTVAAHELIFEIEESVRRGK